MNSPDLSIEYSFLRLPYENAVKVFKQSKKSVEKEFSSLLNQIILLKNDKSQSKQSAQEGIRQLLERLSQLKQKLRQNYQDEESYYEICRKRLQHLHEYIRVGKDDQINYHKVRLKRMIIDYLVREGYYKTAEKMIRDYDLEELMGIEVKLIQEANAVIDDLQKHQCKLALVWCVSNKSKLNRLNSPLEFKLIFQEFIELVRLSQTQKAIHYIQKYSMQYSQSHFDDIKKAMGCILIQPNLHKFPQYQQYFDENRWTYLINLYKKEVYNIFSITTQPLLFVSLQAGIAALKTPYCNDKATQKCNECPTCNKLIQKLAISVPGTQRHTSSIICRITGDIMDEHNIPLALPNGQIYSQKALAEISTKNNGEIICPVTSEKFKLDQTTKVYLT